MLFEYNSKPYEKLEMVCTQTTIFIEGFAVVYFSYNCFCFCTPVLLEFGGLNDDSTAFFSIAA